MSKISLPFFIRQLESLEFAVGCHAGDVWEKIFPDVDKAIDFFQQRSKLMLGLDFESVDFKGNLH